MQVSRNDKLITKRNKYAGYATLAGLICAIGALAGFFFLQQNILVWTVGIILSLLFSAYGNYAMRRWGRPPRPDQVIEKELKGLDDKYHLYAWNLPVPYVLLSPQGVYAFATRDQGGKITVNGSRWSSKFNAARIFFAFAQEGLGNPGAEAADQAGRLEKWIKTKMPEMQGSVQPVVLFLANNVQLTISEPAVPVMQVEGLKKWLRGTGKGTTLKNAEYRALEQLFESAVS
jgi:hypothetical protein